jgi:hypothetical protein
MTEQIKSTADDIINFLKARGGVYTHRDDIILTVEKKDHSQENIKYCLRLLLEKNLIAVAGTEVFYLTGKGWNFLSFDSLVKSENREVEIRREKEAIDLRNAERIYKNYPLTKFMAWFGAISAIILFYLELARLFNWWPIHSTP